MDALATIAIPVAIPGVSHCAETDTGKEAERCEF